MEGSTCLVDAGGGECIAHLMKICHSMKNVLRDRITLMNSGACRSLHVGVKAPGTKNMTTVLSASA